MSFVIVLQTIFFIKRGVLGNIECKIDEILLPISRAFIINLVCWQLLQLDYNALG
jgi:hypothetical protein